jgi:O-antigen/teichoic acid export membrane protein
MIKNRKSLADYAVTVGARGGNRLCMLVVTILLARTLGPVDFGLYSLFFGIYVVLFQAFSGINIAYVREVKSGDREEPEALRMSLYLQAIISALVLVAAWPASKLLGSILDTEPTGHLFIGFITGGLIGIYAVWFGYFQARGSFIKLGLATLLFNVLILLFVVLVILSGREMPLDLIVYAYLAASIALALAGGYTLLKKTKHTKISGKSFSQFSQMAVLNITVTTLYFLYRYIDVYFIQYYLSAADVGVYSSAMKTSMLLSILVGALPTVLLPKAVASMKSWEHTLTYLRKSYLLASGIAVLFGVFWAISPMLLDLLFGDEYSGGGEVLRWLVVGWALNVFYIPIAQIFYGLNKVKWRLFLELAKLTLTVIGMIYLIPIHGILGAAYAIALAILCTLLMSIPISIRLLRENYQRLVSAP